ncbi:MAG: TadE family protein [Actinomycetota bacterium]
MRKVKNENGSSAIEFALVLPVLVMLMVGIFQFGMAYSNYLAITHAAREGARLAAVNQFSEEVVREKAYPVNPDSISISYPSGNVHGESVMVTITYNKKIEIPIWGSAVVPLQSRASMRIEY